jgi:hypothetical protein
MEHDRARRRLLGASAAASAVGVLGALLPVRAARAAGGAWGDLPAGVWPATEPAYRILEIHLYGGLSPWESFYFRPGAGPGYRGFGSGTPGQATFPQLVFNGACAGAAAPGSTSQAFDTSEATHPVHLGPVAAPLWAAPLLDRTRVVVLQHDLLPHEAAIPYAGSGFRLGNPKLAGLGAAIAHRALAIEETKPVAMRRNVPFSFVLRPTAGDIAGDNVQVFSATGQHPGAARPVVIDSDAAGNLLTLLDRNLGAAPRITPEADQLYNYYRAQYRDLLRFSGAGDPIRSRGFADYEAAAGNLVAASLLRTLLMAAPLTPASEAHCAQLGSGSFMTQVNVTSNAIRLAAHLLAHPSTPAHYVGVIDGGLVGTAGGGYDTHSGGHVLATSVNLGNVLSTLRALVDAGQLDLNTTMVVLTTEFGRTPYRSSGGMPNAASEGRDHFPQGFVNVLIGGPITTRAVVGRLRDSDGAAEASRVFNCSDVRAAVLLAAGIFPFADALFGSTDITASLIDTVSHDTTAANIRRELLGRS